MLSRLSRIWKNTALIGFLTLLIVEIVAHVVASFVTGAV